MITVVLADDHVVVRQGLRALLESAQDFEVIGEAGNGLDTLALIQEKQPQVLVVDLMMPGLGGLEVTRRVAATHPEIRVAILSMHASESYVLEALRAGAAGYVLKDASADHLVRAIHEVAAGRRYLSPPLSDMAIEAYARKADGRPPDPYDSLTAREREVLRLAAEGRSSAEIGALLFISPRTVEVHRANLMRKLGLSGHAELIRFAIKRGILSLDG